MTDTNIYPDPDRKGSFVVGPEKGHHMTDNPGITFQQATTFRLHVESEHTPGVYEPATALHLRAAGWVPAEEALAGSTKAVDKIARHMLALLWRALDRPEPGGPIENDFAEAIRLVEHRVHSDVSRGWRRAIEQALGLEHDLINHTPEWAYKTVLAVREIGNREQTMLTRLWAVLGQPEVRLEEGGGWDSALRLVTHFVCEGSDNREHPPWLPELLAALGWQGGTSSQVIAAVRRLVEAGHAQDMNKSTELRRIVAALAAWRRCDIDPNGPGPDDECHHDRVADIADEALAFVEKGTP